MKTNPVLLAMILLLALPALAAEWPVPPPAVVTDSQVLARLRGGEVLVENTRLDESGGAARVRALFRSLVPEVWDRLGDCETNYLFVAGLLECELLEVSEVHAVTRQVVKRHWLVPRLEYVFETAREPYSWVLIRLVSGDLKALEGSWQFESLQGDDLIMVTHEIHVRPDMPVPRWLMRRTLRKDIADMVACLRSVVGGSLDEAGAAADRKRCP